MDNTNNMIVKIISFVFVFLLVGTTGVLALGISTPYWKDHPLEMYPGQTKDVEFLLVNQEGNDIADAFVTLDESAGIAEIISGGEYSVPAGARDVKVILRISVPEIANIGDNYDVKFSVKAVPEEDQGGNVQLAVGYGVSFPVEVVEQSSVPAEPEPQEPAKTGTGNLLIWIITIVAIIIIIFWFIKKKKQV